MDNNTIIARLTTKILELETKVENFCEERNNLRDELGNYKRYLDDIAKEVGFDGHPGNLSNIVKRK